MNEGSGSVGTTTNMFLKDIPELLLERSISTIPAMSLETWSLFLNFFHFFFIIFSVFWILVISGTFFTRQTPGVPKLFDYGAGFIPGAAEMSASLKKLLHDNFFSVSIVQKPWYGHFHYFGAFWGR